MYSDRAMTIRRSIACGLCNRVVAVSSPVIKMPRYIHTCLVLNIAAASDAIYFVSRVFTLYTRGYMCVCIYMRCTRVIVKFDIAESWENCKRERTLGLFDVCPLYARGSLRPLSLFSRLGWVCICSLLIFGIVHCLLVVVVLARLSLSHTTNQLCTQIVNFWLDN